MAEFGVMWDISGWEPSVCCEPSCADHWVDLLGTEQKIIPSCTLRFDHRWKERKQQGFLPLWWDCSDQSGFWSLCEAHQTQWSEKKKNNRRVSLATFRTPANAHNCDVNTVKKSNKQTLSLCNPVCTRWELGAASRYSCVSSTHGD